MTALSEPWPWPVAPSEPNSSAWRRSHVVQQPVSLQTVGELAGGPHRSDRMRRRGADADREHVQSAQCHEIDFVVGHEIDFVVGHEIDFVVAHEIDSIEVSIKAARGP